MEKVDTKKATPAEINRSGSEDAIPPEEIDLVSGALLICQRGLLGPIDSLEMAELVARWHDVVLATGRRDAASRFVETCVLAFRKCADAGYVFPLGGDDSCALLTNLIFEFIGGDEVMLRIAVENALHVVRFEMNRKQPIGSAA